MMNKFSLALALSSVFASTAFANTPSGAVLKQFLTSGDRDAEIYLKHKAQNDESERRLSESKETFNQYERLSQQKANSHTKPSDKSQAGIVVRKITVDTNGRDINLPIKPLLKRYENRTLTRAQMLALVKSLYEVLRDQGYATAAVALQDKKVTNGELKFVIHWGLVQGYLVNGSPATQFNDRAMVAVLPDLTDKPLNIFDIDGIVESTNKTNKSTQVKVIPAETRGYSYLDIRTARSRKPQFSLDFNNSGTGGNADGRNRLGLSADVSDLLGTNDSWNFNFTHRLYKKNRTNVQQNFSLAYSQPISTATVDVRASYLRSHKELQGLYGSYENVSHTKTGAIKLTQMLYRNQKHIIRGHTELEVKQKRSFLANRFIGDPRYTKVTAGISTVSNVFGGRVYFNTSVVQGLNWFGSEKAAYARETGEKPTAHQMRYVTANLNFHKNINTKVPLSYNLRLAGQYSHYVLLTDNQFSIGDEYTVRGFKGGLVSGDHGYYVAQTLSVPFHFRKTYFSNVSPFVGFDYGQVYRITQDQYDTLMGSAVGVKLQSGYYNISLAYAKALKQPERTKHWTKSGVINFNMNIYF